MIIGFTGTQQDITPKQSAALLELLEQYAPETAHHGDCIGADAAFHAICLARGVKSVVIHPPDIDVKRAFCQAAAPATLVLFREPKPYLDRNHDIVDECELLLACPKGLKEERRSGTWATVRYARKQGKPVVIVYPDGNTVHQF